MKTESLRGRKTKPPGSRTGHSAEQPARPAVPAWTAIFWFEIRYHLRQPLFYLVTFFLSVLLFIAGTGHAPGGAVGRLHLNAPAVILEQLVKGIYLVLFLMTAFVVSAAVRDFERRTSELLFSKPISRFDYLTARFAGTMVVCTIAYLVGALSLAASAFMPWLDPARVGPFRLAPYAFGLGVLIIPTLLALGAAFYALASWTRSTLATYLGVVAFFAASATAGIAAAHLETAWIGQLLDPFGVMALGGAVKYWTVAELNTAIPAIGGILLWNRILWLGLGLSALGLSVVTFDPSRSRKRSDRMRDAIEAPSPVGPAIRVWASTTRRVFSRHTVLVQFIRQVRREATTALWNLPFLGILALGLCVLIQAASSAGNLFGMPVHPRTYLMLEALQGGYSIVLLLVVVLYSGELISKERSLELDEIVDSMPTPSGVYAGAKLTALLLVIAVFLHLGVLALVAFQLSSGHTDLELGLYARGVALAAVYPILMMVLASFSHVVARNRIAGYGLVILFILSWDLLEEFGFEHHLYRFASLPPTPYSDLNGYGPFLAPFGWYSLYWGFAALVLIGFSILFWRRGTDDAWRTRWAEARTRLRGPVRALIALGAIGLAAAGSWIFYNSNVLNEYVPSTDAAERRARYERLYRQYQNADLPRIIAVRTGVDIFPDRRRVEIRGSYRIRNRSAKPLHDVHVSIPERVRVKRLILPAHDVILDDQALGYRIFRLRKPLDSGEAIDLGFDLTVENRGFVNHDAQVAVTDNGTYFTKRDFFPVIGYDAHRQLADPDERRRRGLEPVLRIAAIDDLSARRNTPRAPDADRVGFETTVSTSIDQIAVTSGELQREWAQGGRRYFHYRTEIPITHHFAYASARYAVTRSEWKGVAIEIYHHPGHHDNVDRMMDAARKSLAYYTANFGPYQHRYLRIVEFPRYVRDGTAFPGLIALSESMGFNARLNGEEAIDYPFYVTAHEVAHQWWGQQLVGANVQGVGMLHETLAQYSALMVMEAELGRQKMRGVLEYERDWYLRGRAGERGVEAPLALAGGQDYVYYHKGALAMYALRDAVGEVRLNQALSRYLSRAAFAEPPYTTTRELLEEIRPAVPAGWEHMVADLFETITIFNIKVAAATSTERADGTFLVRVELEAHKLRADGTGAEREIPIDDWIDIAVVGEEGGTLLLERRRIRVSPVALEIVVNQRPARILIDPYSKLIDRDRGDNARAVWSAGAQAGR
ncbi:MAG: ABC transporter permease subunit, partial [Acidobacteriota bacterium]|nr:ABC transporter permease subunit [Acidobacteriota bacterium]